MRCEYDSDEMDTVLVKARELRTRAADARDYAQAEKTKLERAEAAFEKMAKLTGVNSQAVTIRGSGAHSVVPTKGSGGRGNVIKT